MFFFFTVLFQCQSLESLSLYFVRVWHWDHISTTRDRTYSPGKMSPSYWIELCSFVCSLLRLRLLLLLMRRWRRRGALALWLQCLFIITPWPAASSLFRHFILKMSRSNLKVTAHIGVQDTTLNRICSQTISRRSGVWVLKTVLLFSAKQFLIFWRLSLCKLTPAKYIVFFPLTMMSHSTQALSISTSAHNQGKKTKEGGNMIWNSSVLLCLLQCIES